MTSTHSKDQDSFIIYSTFKENVGLSENVHNYFEHCNNLDKIRVPYKKLDGKYNGQEELAILRVLKYNQQIANLLKAWKQKSMLLLKNYKHGLYKATLVFKDSKDNKDLGYFRQVEREIASKRDSYTKDGNNYYITTESDTTMTNELEKLGLKT